MINLTQQFKIIFKDRLFYNRYEYAIRFNLDEASCLRELDHDHIDTMIERRKAWREVSLQRFQKTNNTFGNILSRRQKDITEKTVDDLHGLAELLLLSSSDFKLVVSASQGYVYTNDRCLIDQIGELSGLTQKDYSRAVITRPHNTITLKNPKHQFRSYFKTTKLTDEQKGHLMGFLNNQTTARCSPALIGWLAGNFHRTQDYFFIDHTEMLWLTMLSLVCPGLIRKTMKIIPAK